MQQMLGADGTRAALEMTFVRGDERLSYDQALQRSALVRHEGGTYRCHA